MASEKPLVSKNVCVVGAGMARLAAARELRREGHAVTVMEQRGDVGGQWLYDPLGAAAPPVKVHSSMYASVRLISPRECMGFSDFQFVPRRGEDAAGRDARRFPGHHEVYCYLKDFCDAFGLMDVVRLNTKVTRVAMAPPISSEGGGGGFSDVRWQVRSVRVEPESGEEVAPEEEEEFDAIVVANGHYSQPRLPRINGMEQWRRRQLHSHSYRVPDPFRGEVVVMVGCGDSGLDIALDLCGVAKEVHLTAKSVEAAMTPAMSKMLANHAELRLHPQVDCLCEDGRVVFADGTSVVTDTVIYCTGYTYSFPFLDTGGVVTVDENRVGPLFEHVFPPTLAPSLSFVGIPRKVFVPWLFGAQARWIARILSGRSTLPPVEEMLRTVDEYHRAREIAGVPKNCSHDIGSVSPEEMYEFVVKYTDLPRMEEWKIELMDSILLNINDDRETFRDLDDDSDNVREGLKRWLCLSAAPDHAADADWDAAQAPSQN